MIKIVRRAADRLKTVTFHAKLKVLTVLSDKHILFEHHSNRWVKYYPISQPKVFRHFSVYRVRGIASYVENRCITHTQDWFYPKWKSNDVRNAVLVICNEVVENLEIKMKAQIEEFRVNMSNFDTPVWVSKSMGYFVTYDDRDVFVSNGPIDSNRCEATYHRVDLNKYSPILTFSMAIKTPSQEHDRVLNRMFRKLATELSVKGEEIQNSICDVKDNSDRISKTLSLVRDEVCPICGSVLIRNSRDCSIHCINHCDNYYGHSKKLNRRDWYKAVDMSRSKLSNMCYMCGF